MKKAISAETRDLVLNSAWELMSTQGRLDVGMAEIAAAAGVSRQTVFYAFGNRPGLLVAMVRHRDAQFPHAARLMEISRGDAADLAGLLAFLDTWLDYLPKVYPVAVQLETSALTDPDAAAAWNDRFFNQGVRRGFENILGRMAAAGTLPQGSDPARLADLCLALVAPSAWRLLVVECGWSPAAFVESRRRILSALLGEPQREKSARAAKPRVR
jgi:AcrR family transcriptional regulator